MTVSMVPQLPNSDLLEFSPSINQKQLRVALLLHTLAIKQPLRALLGRDWTHFNRPRKSAVDYEGTFEELSSQDVGARPPPIPP